MTEEKRIVPEEKKYAILTKESVKMMAESAGHSDISDSVTGLLGEDVSYRLREITQVKEQGMFMQVKRTIIFTISTLNS